MLAWYRVVIGTRRTAIATGAVIQQQHTLYRFQIGRRDTHHQTLARPDNVIITPRPISYMEPGGDSEFTSVSIQSVRLSVSHADMELKAFKRLL